jgi:hypothetical protein
MLPDNDSEDFGHFEVSRLPTLVPVKSLANKECNGRGGSWPGGRSGDFQAALALGALIGAIAVGWRISNALGEESADTSR